MVFIPLPSILNDRITLETMFTNIFTADIVEPGEIAYIPENMRNGRITRLYNKNSLRSWVNMGTGGHPITREPRNFTVADAPSEINAFVREYGRNLNRYSRNLNEQRTRRNRERQEAERREAEQREARREQERIRRNREHAERMAAEQRETNRLRREDEEMLERLRQESIRLEREREEAELRRQREAERRQREEAAAAERRQREANNRRRMEEETRIRNEYRNRITRINNNRRRNYITSRSTSGSTVTMNNVNDMMRRLTRR